MTLNSSIIKKEIPNVFFNPKVSIMKELDGYYIKFCKYPEEATEVSNNFCSSNKKVVIRLFPSFYHFYTESFASLLLVYSYHKDIEVLVVDVDETLYPSETAKAFERAKDMFFLFLNDNKIQYQIVRLKDIDNSVIDNYLVCDDLWDDSRNQAILLSEMSSKYVNSKNNKTRAYIKTERVKNEPVLIKYLKELGFDIIESNTFNNFIDQMNYYKNTELVVSATCGGLVNISFMDEKSTVVELVTTIKSRIFIDESKGLDFDENNFQDAEQVHHIYDTLSLQKNHTYVSISNIDKTAEDIIKHIENNKLLRVILEQK